MFREILDINLTKISLSILKKGESPTLNIQNLPY